MYVLPMFDRNKLFYTERSKRHVDFVSPIEGVRSVSLTKLELAILIAELQSLHDQIGYDT